LNKSHRRFSQASIKLVLLLTALSFCLSATTKPHPQLKRAKASTHSLSSMPLNSFVSMESSCESGTNEIEFLSSENLGIDSQVPVIEVSLSSAPNNFVLAQLQYFLYDIPPPSL
jgi:hypothetical protein